MTCLRNRFRRNTKLGLRRRYFCGGMAVQVMHMDKEWMIAKTVCRVLSLSPASEKWNSGRLFQSEVPSAAAI
jgi:hypothetical protein